MANVVLIMGKSGSGKSSSIKTLDPKETVIFNVLKKKLPFKGSGKLYNTENKNLFMLDNFNDINSYMQSISEKATYVKNIIIDDSTYIMRKEYFKTAKQTGFNKFVDMADINDVIAPHHDGDEFTIEERQQIRSLLKMLENKKNGS